MKDWRRAKQSEIHNMTLDEALEIIDHHIAMAGETWGPRPHFAKALQILREKATEERIEFGRRYWKLHSAATTRIRTTDKDTTLSSPWIEISEEEYNRIHMKNIRQ